MITFVTTLAWNGNIIKQSLISRLFQNAQDAIDQYVIELKDSINIQGFPGVHSPPGAPPFKQSHNLINSIQVHENIQNEEIHAEASTTVRYAPTLELGGTLQVPESEKVYANFPVYPWGKPTTIAPRPAWIPAFQRAVYVMIHHLMK